MRWNYSQNLNSTKILYGFLPSLISLILILINLIHFNKRLILVSIFIFLILQLVGDFLFYKIKKNEKIFFFKIRFPVTIIILSNIFYLIIV